MGRVLIIILYTFLLGFYVEFDGEPQVEAIGSFLLDWLMLQLIAYLCILFFNFFLAFLFFIRASFLELRRRKP